MVIFLSIALLLMIFLSWILFTPVKLIVDTDQDQYGIFQQGTVSVSFHPRTKKFEMSVLGIRMSGKKKPAKKDQPYSKAKKKRIVKKSPGAWIFLLKRAIKSMSIVNLKVNIDTGDVVLNAQLVPILFCASRGPVYLITNFNGHVYVHLEAKAKLNILAWAFIQFLTKK